MEVAVCVGRHELKTYSAGVHKLNFSMEEEEFLSVGVLLQPSVCSVECVHEAYVLTGVSVAS